MEAILLDLQTAVFPLEVIYAACYAFTDRTYVRLEELPDSGIRVALDPKKPAGPEERRRVEGDFRNELLHHALRLKVSAANQKLREYIVTRALLSCQPGRGSAPGPDTPTPPGSGEMPLTGMNEVRPALDPMPSGGPVREEQKPGPDGAPRAADAPLHRQDEAGLAVELEALLSDGGGEVPLGLAAPWDEKAPAPQRAAKPKGAAKKTRVKP